MNPSEYQKLAKRTECPQLIVCNRLATPYASTDLEPISQLHANLENVAILHASVGISGEAGEISAAIERWLWYGKGLDRVNLKEELGDLLWYVAEMCNALNISMDDVMEANIAKLRQRYPEKYSDERAAEENRDREKEREILAAIGPAPEFTPFDADAEKAKTVEQNGNGFAELPEEHEYLISLDQLSNLASIADGPFKTGEITREQAIDTLWVEAVRLGLSRMRHNNWTEVFNEIREERTKRNE